MNHRNLRPVWALCLGLSLLACMLGSSALASSELRADGRFFRDRAGRAVILRGVNVSGGSKVPPYIPFSDPARLDQLADWGVNVIRLVFNWEAYEPMRGVYADDYLRAQVEIARAAWERGIFTIVDIHQDGYSRYQLSGCGDGFPEWAIPARIRRAVPDNSARSCASWGGMMFSDADMLACFTDFYADRDGVRADYLALLTRIAGAFGAVPGVIGYDPLNEPWGREDTEILPLYESAATAIRAVDASAILFLEGQILTNTGLQSNLSRPTFGNFAYAPHYYDSLAMVLGAWSGVATQTDLAFFTMNAKAATWNVPLLLGEFGIAATAGKGLAFTDLLYERLNDYLASGTYWNWSPGWTAASKDGWNGEDFSLIDDRGAPRATFRFRPFPRHIPGTPTRVVVKNPGLLSASTIEVKWQHDSTLGRLEVYAPVSQIWGGTPLKIETEGDALRCWLEGGKTLLCESTKSGDKRVKLRPCVTLFGACL